MKKRLLFLLLLIPFSVYAESELPEHGFVDGYRFPRLMSISTYQYSFSVRYENGVYVLEEPFYNYAKRIRINLDFDAPIPTIYTCKSETNTTCSIVYAGYLKGADWSSRYYPVLELENGETEEENMHFMMSDSYHKEGNRYVLDNPEEAIIQETILHPDNYKKKYFCDNLTSTCEELYKIEEADATLSYIISSSNDYLYGEGFDYVGGRFILKGIQESKWPNYEEYVGLYTCMSKESSCDTLYKINNFVETEYWKGGASFDMYIPSHFEGTKVNFDLKKITLEKSKNLNVNEYLENSNTVWIEDESIITIENNTIKPLRKGKTTVLIEKNDEVILLRVEITDKDIINPNTYRNIAVFIILLMMMGVLTIYIQTQKKKDD